MDHVNDPSMSLILIEVNLESLPVQGWIDCLRDWIARRCVLLLNIGRMLNAALH